MMMIINNYFLNSLSLIDLSEIKINLIDLILLCFNRINFFTKTFKIYILNVL